MHFRAVHGLILKFHRSLIIGLKFFSWGTENRDVTGKSRILRVSRVDCRLREYAQKQPVSQARDTVKKEGPYSSCPSPQVPSLKSLPSSPFPQVPFLKSPPSSPFPCPFPRPFRCPFPCSFLLSLLGDFENCQFSAISLLSDFPKFHRLWLTRENLFFKLLIFSTRSLLVFESKMMRSGTKASFWNNAQILCF